MKERQDKRWQIICLGKQGMTKIYDPYGKDVTPDVAEVNITILEGDIPDVSIKLKVDADIDISAYQLFYFSK